LGYTKVAALLGGLHGWEAAGLPVEKAVAAQ
jgi:3-mercaptopyruvate sulfurtransferase SseA